jgi:hypothetical protein
MRLAYRVQTAVQMGMLGLQEQKVVRFDPIEEEILL